MASVAIIFSPDQLQKTIDLKNTQISELVEELRKTQELHVQIKKKYLSEESKLREKMRELQLIADELRAENCDLIKKYRASQISLDEYAKMYDASKQEWQRDNYTLRATIEKLKVDNMELRGAKGELQQKLRAEQEIKIRREEEIRNLGLEISRRQQQLEDANRSILEKQKQWNKVRDDMTVEMQSISNKQSNNNRIALDEMENRIRAIMIHL